MLARNIGPRLAVSRRARHNLKNAFPALSAAEIANIVAQMWDNLGRVAAEYPHIRKIRVFEPGGRVETHGFEHMDRAVAGGRRMIIFSGHLANWEIGMVAAVQYGAPVAQIYRAANRLADIAALMAKVNRTLEGWIRDRPEQWFWLHRRWPD
jgi:KDO2-lipid IV(A) lauroyltransferase